MEERDFHQKAGLGRMDGVVVGDVFVASTAM